MPNYTEPSIVVLRPNFYIANTVVPMKLRSNYCYEDWSNFGRLNSAHHCDRLFSGKTLDILRSSDVIFDS